jgi:hypothetical protein
MTLGRAIDHVGILGHNLDALAAQYEALDFTLTPRAWHEDRMGTSNRLAQFRGRNFIELIEVDRPEGIAPHGPDFLSFGAFGLDYLARRQGLGLVVFRTQDAAADVAAWRAKGLDTYAPFNFTRQAKTPDGTAVTVSFSLGFVTSPMMPDILFFVCENRAEEHFWKPAFQDHINGAVEIVSVVLCAAEPARHGDFLGGLFDGAVTDRNGGISVSCGAHRIDVVKPQAISAMGWRGEPGNNALGAGLVIRTAGTAGHVTSAADAGGAFIEWIN